MHPGHLSRRGFVRRTTGALMATGLPAWYARDAVAAEEAGLAREARRVAAVDNLVVGLIGCGGMGTGDLKNALRHQGVECAAVCDVDASHAEKVAREVGKEKSVAKYHDFRELLDREDIDVAIIGTPDHWHTIPALYAARKNKDIYCEKPLTLTIDEGKALVKAVRKHDRVLQVGSQQRSDRRFHLACELVRNGRLGKIRTVETWIGNNPKEGPFPTAPVPEGLDWDFWCGQTPLVDYVKERCHGNFRWWYEYSGGKMTDWGAHHNDIAQWGLGMDGSGPVTISATGEPPTPRPNSYNCHPDFVVTYTYGKDAGPVCDGSQVICSTKENGVQFTGEDGQWLFVSRSKIEASDPKLLEEPLADDAIKLYNSRDHMGNFLDCVRDRQRPICDVEVGHRSVSVCHLGVIALRIGGSKELQWDPVRERFVGDALADEFLSRPMRAPWSLEA